MKFSAFDMISKLVPGGLLVSLSLLILLPVYVESQFFNYIISILEKFSGLLTILVLLFTYFIGYLLEGVGSMVIEPNLFKLWGGWPVELLRLNKTNKRTTFPQYKEVFDLLDKSKFGEIKLSISEDEIDSLYYFADGILRVKGNDNQITKQQGLLETYLFNRNLLAAIIIGVLSFIPMAFYNTFYIYVLLFLILILIFVFIRVKDKALHQTKHILTSAYHLLRE